MEELDEQLNLDGHEENEAMLTHTPLGEPLSEREDVIGQACQLTQTDYITAFSADNHMPLWTAFSLKQQVGGDIHMPLWPSFPLKQ